MAGRGQGVQAIVRTTRNGRHFTYVEFVSPECLFVRGPGGVGGPTASDFVHFIANEQWGAGPTPGTYSAIYNTAVGDPIQVTGSLVAKSQDAGLFAGSGPSNSVMDASNTSSLIFRPVTAGASYTTDSGTTYVPEPTGLLLGL